MPLFTFRLLSPDHFLCFFHSLLFLSFQQVDPAVLDSLREANAKLESDVANLQQQLNQISSKLNEATEYKLKVVGELSQAKEEALLRQAELAQKNSDVAVREFLVWYRGRFGCFNCYALFRLETNAVLLSFVMAP